MRSRRKRVGTKVKVREHCGRAELRGISGTVVRRWGAPAYAVLEVRMDNGQRKLFWDDELELADGLVTAWLPLPFYDGS